MTGTDALPIERLLEHRGWLERLARRLVGDQELADDLSQETWVRALEHPPLTDRPLRGWLATVMRNVLLQRRRGEGRRSARERRVARHEALPSSLELVERVTTERALARAVLELDEPYRTTLLLRYFEGLEARRVAERQGVPLATVKTRIARGHERLRLRLDQAAGGDGRAWLSGLAPLLRPRAGALSGATSTAATGALLLNAKTATALALLGAVSLGALALSRTSAERPGVEPSVRGAAPPLERAPELAGDGRERTVERVRLPEEAPRATVPPPAPSGTPPATPGPARVRGRVLDMNAAPVANATVEHDPGGEQVRSDAAGAFELELERTGGGLLCVEPGLATVLAGTWVAADTGHESIVVVAPAVTLGGRVVDVHGLPVAGVRLALEPPAGLRSRIPRVLDHSEDLAWTAGTGTPGTFRLEDAPFLAGGSLTARAEGYRPHSQELRPHDDENVLIVLERAAEPRALLRGEVLDRRGAPVPGARVSLGIDTTVADEEGRFFFDLEPPDSYARMLASMDLVLEPAVLTALAPGHLPGRAEARRDAEGRPVWPELVTLRLGEAPLSIAGRVTDVEGAPRPGIEVWIVDPTFFGALGDAVLGERPDLVHAETLIAGAAAWEAVETDEGGRFELGGLLPRTYVVAAMVPETLQRVQRREVRAGTRDLELKLSTADVFGTVRGRVVDSRGRGVAGARIRAMADPFRYRIEERVVRTRHAVAEGVVTDAEGRFTLRDVPRDLAYLRVDGTDIIPEEWGRHVEGGLASLVDDPGRVEVPVSLRCHFRVELADPGEADELALLDEEERELVISEFAGTGRRETERHALVQGRSAALAVSDAARTLVLLRNGVELRRVPVRLVGGELTTLRP